MKKVDYIVVGLGIAGVCFCKHLIDNNHSFIVITDALPGATKQSGGVFNPIVLRRFTAPDDTPKFTEFAVDLYTKLEQLTQRKFCIPEQEVFRVFASIEEQNNWFTASDKRHLKSYITPKVEVNTNPSISAKFGLGRVSNSFKINPDIFLESITSFLKSQEKIKIEPFEYSSLKSIGDESWQYKNIMTKNIVFSQGVKVLRNPFISAELILPNKGEFLIIHSPTLKLNSIIKGGVYIIPLGSDNYKVGATYSPSDLSINATVEAKEEIITKLENMITCEYQIIDQVVGVRPVTKDRQPIIGKVNKGMYIFNGLGARGFTRGPLYSKILYDAIECSGSIPKKMDVSRFSVSSS